MNKLFILLVFSVGINATAQVATSGTTNSGTNASAIGYQSSATNTVSTAIGRETLASGITSTAMGYQTSATNTASTAIGNSSTASGVTSTAIGNNSTASGETSIAMGFETEATDSASIAMGYQTTSTGGASTAMGFITTASGFGSTSIGYKTTASGYGSTSIGYQTTASGNSSTAIGKNTIASDFGSLVIGQYNLSGSTVTNSAIEANYANTAFVIGNGTASNAKSDAFKVMVNGNTTVGNDLTVSGDVVVSSDARLKANIVSLGSTLAKLLLIDGKTYTMKKDGKQKIGVLAQDIQKVFPELVTTDNKDMLAVNYQGLVPVLINALKEQQSEIDELKEMFKELITKQE
ncbi:tail fiber domain-containing protein [Flavobacteriaceae bacterium]|nr:tail fiber domain-containing protein [Flavobacteriaceae bacterium]